MHRLFCSLMFLLATFSSSHHLDAQNKKQEPEKQFPEFRQFGIYAKTAPRARTVEPRETRLPLVLQRNDRIALIGNTLFERMQLFGHFEALLHQQFPSHELVVRNLAWSGDTPDIQPRPANFADLDQHLTHERIDVIFAAFGFNESFAGPSGTRAFRESLSRFVSDLKTKAFNGKRGPQIVLVSPIANEDVSRVKAALQNNSNIATYRDTIREVANEHQVGFVDAYDKTLSTMGNAETDLTINGAHLNETGYAHFSGVLFEGLFNLKAATPDVGLRAIITDKNRQYFRRYRPLNTFYYTGDRNRSYGYLDFLPAMRNFDILVSNRERKIWDTANGTSATPTIDDSNVPDLPITDESRGANRWMSAEDELKSFKVDERFDVSIFAEEERFPDIAAPIQMRWDSQGRLWVSCSKTYPHVYPGNEPDDKLVILEDTDGDGRADKSTVFADNLHIPLSFEFGDGGVYVSEMPHLTFLRDSDGDGKADQREVLLSGFGTEDSHHALHDFAWSPDGDLIFRESIFHHSQVETAYGPVRMRDSGWFRFDPKTLRLTSFGSYMSTNPWGVTFDDWGRHVASHPIFAAAFHSLNPPYPDQHPRPKALQAYSGTCGQEFVDFGTFPRSLRDHFIKVRYKPTNRVEIHQWNRSDFGFEEKYVGDLIFSSNLSFIPVDLRFGPRGALYVCDWYNPIKGHAQYSLRDDRRDRHSGRIWRITTKGIPLQSPPKIAGSSIPDLLKILTRPEYRYRYWAKRELRNHGSAQVRLALDQWVADLPSADPRFRHHQVEALWMYRSIGESNHRLLRELLGCDNRDARAASVQQLRYEFSSLSDHIDLLRSAINDSDALVRMEAAIAATYIGSKAALDTFLDIYKHPQGGHLAYAIQCALRSQPLQRHWKGNAHYDIAALLKRSSRADTFKEPPATAAQAQFDIQSNLKLVRVSCIPERMQFTVRQIVALTGQPLKIVFDNPDATDHNLVVVQPGALAEVGMAANAMARDPKNANSDFIPDSKRDLILHASPMIGPTRKSLVHVFRFEAPRKPGIYPYVCTFPGHWVIMTGQLVVVDKLDDVDSMIAAQAPKLVKQWTMTDFPNVKSVNNEAAIMRGMQAFVKAKCNQCHQIAGHGVNLGPDLMESRKELKGKDLLQQILEPSSKIHEKYQNHQFALKNGKVIGGIIVEETKKDYRVLSNLLDPRATTRIPKRTIEEMATSKVSAMPNGLVDVLTKEEIVDLLSYLENGVDMPHHSHKK